MAAAEQAALTWQRLLPALQSASGSPLSAMAHTLFEVQFLSGRGSLTLLDVEVTSETFESLGPAGCSCDSSQRCCACLAALTSRSPVCSCLIG